MSTQPNDPEFVPNAPPAPSHPTTPHAVPPQPVPTAASAASGPMEGKGDALWSSDVHAPVESAAAELVENDDFPEDHDEEGADAGTAVEEVPLSVSEMSKAARYGHSFGYHHIPSATSETLVSDLSAALASLSLSPSVPAAEAEADAAADTSSLSDAPASSFRGLPALFYDSRVLLHQANYNHVEGPQRVLRSFEALVGTGLWEQCTHVTVGGQGYAGFGAPAELASVEHGGEEGKTAAPTDESSSSDTAFAAALQPRLLRPLRLRPLYSVPRPLLPVAPVAATHSRAAIARVAAAAAHPYGADEPDSEDEGGDPTVYPDCRYIDQHRDTYVNAFTPVSTRVALTGVVACTRAVASGAVQTAFALLRPPGHHASADGQAGFCLFNNVAVAVNDARARFPETVKRVLVVDWDVHHGDGTQALFYDDPDVLFVSLHRFHTGFFPGTGASAEVGAGAGAGRTINIPFPGPGYGDAEYLAAFDALVLPIARAFKPDLVIVSAGMDCLASDPLGGMSVTPACLAAITRRLRDRSLGAQGRLVAVLEGGYNPDAVAEGVCAVVAALGEVKPLVSVKEVLTRLKKGGTSVHEDASLAPPIPESNSNSNSVSSPAASSATNAASLTKRREAAQADFRLRCTSTAVATTAKKLAPWWPVAGEIGKVVDKHGVVLAAGMMNRISGVSQDGLSEDVPAVAAADAPSATVAAGNGRRVVGGRGAKKT